MSHSEFIRKHPEFRHLPEFIVGAGNKRIRLMDATYADFRWYMAFLDRRIQRKLGTGRRCRRSQNSGSRR